jgi:hypothetical protein
MVEDTDLIEKREEIKRQAAAGEYKPLTEVIVDTTGHLIQKLTRNPKPPPFWYSTMVIFLVIHLIDILTKILLGENHGTMPHLIGVNYFLAAFWLTGSIFAGIIGYKIYLDLGFTTFGNHLLDAIESRADLTDFQHWLAAFGNTKKPLFFSLAFGPVFGLYSSIYLSTFVGGFIGFGSTIFLIILGFFGGILIYFIFLSLPAPMRISRYQYKLYAADPSSSEIIDHLSNFLAIGVYLIAVGAAILTVFFTFFGLLTKLVPLILVILLFWFPMTVLFVMNQYALAKIITRAKWKKLNEIQAKVEKLEAEENIADKETMETVKRLIDYHNQIKDTPNSALNIRAGLNFLNSLLLPVIAFLLANLDKVLGLF